MARVPWTPLYNAEDPTAPTPQRLAYDCEADFLFYGGAAGGGKTDLLIGLSLTEHKRSVIYRREFKQLRAIIDRTRQIVGTDKGLNKQDGRWSLGDDQIVDYGSCQHAGDEQAYQGQPHDFVGYDEITHFLESQFRFLCGWNRTTDEGQRCRVVCAGNPPTDAEGEWVIRFWAPWLDETHPNPARPGELRWFAVLDGEDVEVDGPAPFGHGSELIVPKSRTFIPSSVDDNPFLQSTGYKSVLQALPEPLRSQMLKGDFTAGHEDNPYQVIPTEWVRLAQERWAPDGKGARMMSAMGVDPARGGADATVLSPRYGTWFAEQKVYPGGDTPDGPAVAALVVAALRDAAPIQMDVIGIGSSVYDHLKGNRLQVVAIQSAEASHETDRSGTLRFFNKRAELWWKFREALDPAYGSDIDLPPDRELRVDLCAPRWKLTQRGIQVEAKEDIIKRIGRSPDRGDGAVYAWEENAKVSQAMVMGGGAPAQEYSELDY
ncbi:MAG TPA: terminase [Marinobacter sp.]|uniref:Uncharacterized protein n=1 Tax=marine sediment metagenome TaxID=412755 RepID=A0A0F9J4P9_9ZZZZ|nr:terminase [Marinobacter sp.]